MKAVKEAVFYHEEAFLLESGASLPGFKLRYATWGKLNPAKDNVVWVCHALTGSHEFHVWWEGLFGKGKVYDPEAYFIICVNTLGGCNGSTGPLEDNPVTGRPYYHEFPAISNRDIVGAFDLLSSSLGISEVHTLIGGSLGGQHALEWSILRPSFFKHLVLLATNVQHSPWGIAFNESQRMAIESDPTWAEDSDTAGLQGMKAARATALLSYRNYRTYHLTQQETTTEKLEGFKASSYQRYQGEKLARRFNAFTYWRLSEAMDSHQVARGRGELVDVLKGVQAKTLVMGIDSDILFPVDEQRLIASLIPGASFELIHSDYGHDGFLIEFEKISIAISAFYGHTKTSLTIHHNTSCTNN